MLNFIVGIWKRRQRERERAIFRFWDGRRERAIDPMPVWAALQADPEYVGERHNALIDAGDIEAQQIAVRAVQRVFNVAPFESGGLTHAECLGLLLGYYVFLDDLKKSTEKPLTSPPPTESASSAPSPTSAVSDSGKTPVDPNSDNLPA